MCIISCIKIIYIYKILIEAGCTMGKGLFDLGVLKSLKGKNIRFNPRPFSNPLQESTNTIKVEKDMSFVDLHLEVAQKVDALIAQLEQEQPKPEEWELTPQIDSDLAPGKILSSLDNKI